MGRTAHTAGRLAAGEPIPQELDIRIMPLLPAGDYRPDVSDYEGQATRNILNVIPRGDGYGPFPGFSPYTSALPASCRGAFYALKSDGTVVTFAGTVDRLYRLSNSDFTWRNVSATRP